MADALLSVEHLTTVFDLPTGPVPAADDISFEIRAGETLGLVGESGSGKSVTALSIMRLVQPPGRIARGRIRFKGRDLLTLSERDMQSVRGAEIALIFQERSEEHTSELQSRLHLVCRLLLEKKKKKTKRNENYVIIHK